MTQKTHGESKMVVSKMQTKSVSPDDVATALTEIAALRDRLEWRRRDLRLMFIQSPELGGYYDAFQVSGGVTADEWMAFVAGLRRGAAHPLRSGVRRKAHLRLI